MRRRGSALSRLACTSDTLRPQAMHDDIVGVMIDYGISSGRESITGRHRAFLLSLGEADCLYTKDLTTVATIPAQCWLCPR